MLNFLESQNKRLKLTEQTAFENSKKTKLIEVHVLRFSIEILNIDTWAI
jgi:hypothetical protein